MSSKTVFVLMKSDVEKVGMAGSIVKVAKAYAENYLAPNKLGSIISEKELGNFEAKKVKIQQQKEVLESKTSMLAERIKSTPIVIKAKIHDDKKLYGSIKEEQIVDALKEKGINIAKKQVEFVKSIKSLGEYEITIRLSSKLQPKLGIKIVALD